jgi:hypothetical protein
MLMTRENTHKNAQEYLRKLKFQYLEEYAKDKYVKTIVNDDPPEVTAEDNESLQTANVLKKEALKASKTKLAEKHDDIRRLAPLVEQGASTVYICYY